ncbi:MAG: zinc ribbon domain-containing protein [Syntrophomonadaceae bacterium]|nr:zinc ribbon domain-containing protein [Syntrophomonadaceae bacterium]
MLKAFTRNYEDNSTEAGFQFTFYCDNCSDGYKSSFIESETYKKGKGLRGLAAGVGLLGSLIGGSASSLGYAAERGSNILSERFTGMSPEWQKEHDKAFERGQNEAHSHFHRCHSCHKYVCDVCHNEEEGLCVECAPRQEIFVAKARADAMRRNIEEAGDSATVWQGRIESKQAVCSSCGKPAGSGKFCSNCGASMELAVCLKCGAKNAHDVRFCNNCGTPMNAPKAVNCPGCGEENSPGTNFCGGCGTKL